MISGVSTLARSTMAQAHGYQRPHVEGSNRPHALKTPNSVHKAQTGWEAQLRPNYTCAGQQLSSGTHAGKSVSKPGAIASP
jgi:hypothetical protein